MNTAQVVNYRNGRTEVFGTSNRGVRFLIARIAKWDMRYVYLPKKRWSLDERDDMKFIEVIDSPQGVALVNRLRNELANKIVNDFLQFANVSIPENKYRKAQGDTRQPLKEFLTKVMNEPLIGENMLHNHSIGLTKRMIWEAMIIEGLVKPTEYAEPKTS